MIVSGGRIDRIQLKWQTKPIVLLRTLLSIRVWRTRFRLLRNCAVANFQGASIRRVDRHCHESRSNACMARADQCGSEVPSEPNTVIESTP